LLSAIHLRAKLALEFVETLLAASVSLSSREPKMSQQEHHRQALRPGEGALLGVTLSAEIERLKSRPEWTSGDRSAVSLVKDDALNVLLMVLKKGARLHEHHTRGPIVVQVLSGSIRLAAGGRKCSMSSGMMAALDREIVHSVEALKDAAVLLTTAIG
jgi:quercetin dioxygenase-like cupin family protein